MVTKSDIASALRELGLQEDSKVVVHSSLKSFGYVDGGAKTVVDALMETVKDGTLVLPSFNHGAPYDEGGVFDIRTTPTTNGAIPEEFRKREGVFRSMNPTHAFALWGKDAEETARAHEMAPAMGEGSPMDYLYRHGGYVLLLGVGYTRNTFHHYVETMEQSPCLYARGEEYDVIDENGEMKRARTWSWRSKMCPIDDAARYAPLMKACDKTIKIGECTATLYPMKEGYEIIKKALKEGIDGYPCCAECPIRPRICEFTAEEYR